LGKFKDTIKLYGDMISNFRERVIDHSKEFEDIINELRKMDNFKKELDATEDNMLKIYYENEKLYNSNQVLSDGHKTVVKVPLPLTSNSNDDKYKELND